MPNDVLTVPPPGEIKQRIEQRRQEIAALKVVLRLSRAVAAANQHFKPPPSHREEVAHA